MSLSKFEAVLCDLGGVLYVGDTPIKGAVEAVNAIKRNYPIRFLTNTTQKRSEQVCASLQKMGFDIHPHEIITALDVTKTYLQEQRSSAYYLLTDEAESYFDDISFENINFVVVGDAQENFNYRRLNTAFRHLQKGARLIAAARNRYFKDSDNMLSMDAGGFVQALEYASDTRAKVIGKPSEEFYRLACSAIGCRSEDCIMIGDDIESDIGGAKEAGLQTVLVKTGKFRAEDLNKDIQPDIILESIRDFVP